MNWYRKFSDVAPQVNWGAQDNYGIWTVKSVAQFLGVQPDQYIYQDTIDINLLPQSLVEETDADDIRRRKDDGAFDQEVMEFYDEAKEILDKHDKSQFHDPTTDEWRDFLVYDYDEDDVINLAREMLARERENWGQEEMGATFSGGYPPIVITKQIDGTFIVNDGNHRVDTWKKQGLDEAPAWINDEYARNQP